jgi:hypothetical protein
MHTAEVSSANAPTSEHAATCARVPVARASAALRALDASDTPDASELRAQRRRRLCATRTRPRTRRGAVLVEFALIAIAFYILLAGTIELGRMIFAEQILQNAARVGARELALMPLPADYTFAQALSDQNVKKSIFDPSLLAFEVSSDMTDQKLKDTVDKWPIINRMLVPLMVQEELVWEGSTLTLFHYPGALLVNNDHNASSPFVVGIPELDESGLDITWHPVVEEIVPTGPGTQATDAPFSMTFTNPNREVAGLVALCINYPFQAATVVAYKGQSSSGLTNEVVEANDGGMNSGSTAALNAEVADIQSTPNSIASYGGKYGLGTLYAAKPIDSNAGVRPFRRFLTAQSIFRREVFR